MSNPDKPPRNAQQRNERYYKILDIINAAKTANDICVEENGRKVNIRKLYWHLCLKSDSRPLSNRERNIVEIINEKFLLSIEYAAEKRAKKHAENLLRCKIDFDERKKIRDAANAADEADEARLRADKAKYKLRMAAWVLKEQNDAIEKARKDKVYMENLEQACEQSHRYMLEHAVTPDTFVMEGITGAGPLESPVEYRCTAQKVYDNILIYQSRGDKILRGQIEYLTGYREKFLKV